MSKIRVKLCGCLCILILATVLVANVSFAHPGRTDSNGGHYVRKSGWGYPVGSYHYHNGGSSTIKSTKSNQSSGYSYESNYIDPKVVATDIKTFINGSEIPTFEYISSNKTYVVIVAEDLKNYGFDTAWDESLNELKVVRNKDKKFDPISMDYYRKFKKGQKVFSTNGSLIVYVNDTNTSKLIWGENLNGYIAIGVDELAPFGEFKWDKDSRTVSITLN